MFTFTRSLHENIELRCFRGQFATITCMLKILLKKKDQTQIIGLILKGCVASYVLGYSQDSDT